MLTYRFWLIYLILNELGCGGAVTANPCDTESAICGSPVVLASNLHFTCSIALDATFVYWVDCQGANSDLMKVPINGGTPTTLVSGLTSEQSGFLSIAVDAESIYWTSLTAEGGLILKAPLNGGPPVTLASVDGVPNGLAVNATSVFVATGATGTNGTVVEQVLSVPIGGGTPSILATNDQYPGSLAIDGTNIYWTQAPFSYRTNDGVTPDQGTVMKMPLGGGTPTTLTSGQSQPFGIVVYDTNVYWADQFAKTVMSMPINGGTPTTLATCQDDPTACPLEPRDIAANSTDIYWVEEGKLLRVPFGGGTPTILVTQHGLGLTSVFAVDDTNLYWSELGDDGDWSLKKLRVH